MSVNLPTAFLRNFVAIVDAGSMLHAADRVFLSQSALSTQIKRLEELVGRPLFHRESRRLTLTPSGEILLHYARRLLNMHDEAIGAVQTGRVSKAIRIGMAQDFAGSMLTDLMARFTELHEECQIHARVAPTAQLQTMLGRAELDFIISFAEAHNPKAVRVDLIEWHGEQAAADLDVVPLAVLERPCHFRDAAVASLEAAGRRFRFAVETPNLTTLQSAVKAGLGVTCRTHLFLDGMKTLNDSSLPSLPMIASIVSQRAGSDPLTGRMAELTSNVIRGL